MIQRETALATTGPVIDGIVMMTVAEAEQAERRILATASDLRQQLYDFEHREGWSMLGFDSFRAWAKTRIPDKDVRYLYRLRDANEVDRQLGAAIGHTPESHARQVKGLPEGEVREVFERADALAAAEGRPRQAKDLAAAREPIRTPAYLAAAGYQLLWSSQKPGQVKLLRPKGAPSYHDGPAQAVEAADVELSKAPPASKYPADWDAARARAAAVGARLWYNESDGTFTLSERAGHVPRTSSWSELRAWLQQLERKHRESQAAAPVGPVQPTLSGAELGELSRRASSLGGNLLGRGTETVLVEPDGTQSRYPTGAEQQLADRIAHLERQAAPPAPPTADADEPDDHSIAIYALLREQLPQHEPIVRVLARMMCFPEEAERALTAPIDEVIDGLRVVWDELGREWIGDSAAILAVLQAAPTAPDRGVDAEPGPRGLAELVRDVAALEAATGSYLPAKVRAEAERLDERLQEFVEALSDEQYEDLAARISRLRRHQRGAA